MTLVDWALTDYDERVFHDEGENCATSNDNRQQQEEPVVTVTISSWPEPEPSVSQLARTSCHHQCTDSSSMDSWNSVGSVETIRTETAETKSLNFPELKRILVELKQLYPFYVKCFLSCQRCVSFGILRPHCKCGGEYFMDGGLHGCVQMCPDLTKCTKDNRQLSHCPTCFNIGKGISGHKTLSSVIDVYICASCEDFHSRWNSSKNKHKLEGLKCDSNSGKNDNCLQDRQRNCNSSING